MLGYGTRLEDSDPVIRSFAIDALGRQGAEGAAHASRVAARLQDSDADVRAHAKHAPDPRNPLQYRTARWKAGEEVYDVLRSASKRVYDSTFESRALSLQLQSKCCSSASAPPASNCNGWRDYKQHTQDSHGWLTQPSNAF